MRILVIHRHYWPDATPSAIILRDILQRLADDGQEVEVFTAAPACQDTRHPRQPSCRKLDRIRVRRIGLLPERTNRWVLRLINYCWFLSRAVLQVVLRRDYDLVWGSSQPPVLMGFALRMIRRLTGTPFIYHCQELQPDFAVLGGRLRWKPLVRFLIDQDTRTCQAAQSVVVLSNDMQNTMVERGVDADKVQIINNFTLYCAPHPVPVPPEFTTASSDTFRLLFAGNLGACQALDRVISAAHLLEEQTDIQFLFMGGGAQRAQLRHQARTLLNKTVHFYDFQPTEVAYCYMSACDLGIVSLDGEIYRAAFPSKTMTYLAAGLPLLAIVEPTSGLAEMVRNHELGYVVRSRSPHDIASAILVARDAVRAGHGIDREHLRWQSTRLFGRGQTLDRWSRLMAHGADGEPPAMFLSFPSVPRQHAA